MATIVGNLKAILDLDVRGFQQGTRAATSEVEKLEKKARPGAEAVKRLQDEMAATKARAESLKGEFAQLRESLDDASDGADLFGVRLKHVGALFAAMAVGVAVKQVYDFARASVDAALAAKDAGDRLQYLQDRVAGVGDASEDAKRTFGEMLLETVNSSGAIDASAQAWDGLAEALENNRDAFRLLGEAAEPVVDLVFRTGAAAAASFTAGLSMLAEELAIAAKAYALYLDARAAITDFFTGPGQDPEAQAMRDRADAVREEADAIRDLASANRELASDAFNAAKEGFSPASRLGSGATSLAENDLGSGLKKIMDSLDKWEQKIKANARAREEAARAAEREKQKLEQLEAAHDAAMLAMEMAQDRQRDLNAAVEDGADALAKLNRLHQLRADILSIAQKFEGEMAQELITERLELFNLTEEYHENIRAMKIRTAAIAAMQAAARAGMGGFGTGAGGTGAGGGQSGGGNTAGQFLGAVGGFGGIGGLLAQGGSMALGGNIVGAVGSVVQGLLGLGDSAAQARRQFEQARRQWQESLESFSKLFLDQTFMDDAKDQIDAAFKGLVESAAEMTGINVKGPLDAESIAAMMDALKAMGEIDTMGVGERARELWDQLNKALRENADALKRAEEQLKKQKTAFIEQIQLRTMEAAGMTEEAEALRISIERAKLMEEARRLEIVGYEQIIDKMYEVEAAARAAAEAAEAEAEAKRKAQEQATFAADLSARQAALGGDDMGAFKIRLAQSQAEELARAQELFEAGVITEDQLKALAEVLKGEFAEAVEQAQLAAEFAAKQVEFAFGDLEVRLLMAKGMTEEAQRRRLEIQHQRELAQAILDGMGEDFINFLLEVQEAEKKAFEESVEDAKAKEQAASGPARRAASGVATALGTITVTQANRIDHHLHTHTIHLAEIAFNTRTLRGDGPAVVGFGGGGRGVTFHVQNVFNGDVLSENPEAIGRRIGRAMVGEVNQNLGEQIEQDSALSGVPQRT